MLVPLDLQVLVQKVGRLTPELVLAWKTASYIDEFFDGLDDVRVAVPAEGDLAEGLRATLTESRFPLHVHSTDEPVSDCHVLVWHQGTGTVLEFTFAADAVDMDAPGVQSADGARSGDFYARTVHGASLDRQVIRLIQRPMEELCRVRPRRIYGGHGARDPQPRRARCRRCGDAVPASDLWYEDGVAVCPSCLCIPATWTRDS